MASKSVRGIAQGPASKQKSGTSTRDLIPKHEKDPYKSIAIVSHGIVGKVEREEKVYARKTIIYTTESGQEKTLRHILHQLKILRRLKHKYIVEVVDMYFFQNQLYLVTAQVANENMKEFLERVNEMSDGDERNSLRRKMQMWPGFLIQAIDYLHYMDFKHKDLKPAKILIVRDQVLIADFGFSNDLVGGETTTSVSDAERGGVSTYSAPDWERSRRVGHLRSRLHFPRACNYSCCTSGLTRSIRETSRDSRIRGIQQISPEHFAVDMISYMSPEAV